MKILAPPAFAGAFFADHGHWPEQCCVERNCMKAEMKAEFDKLKAELSIQN